MFFLGKRFGTTFPLVYALTTRKNQKTYESLLQKLKEHEPLLSPTQVTLDFDMAAINAANSIFPNALTKAKYEQKKPRFGLELWNVHTQTIEGSARTKNSVEAWHNAMKQFVSSKHPDIYSFIKKIKNEQVVQSAKMAQALAGIQTTTKRKKYLDADARIRRAVACLMLY